MNPRNLCGTGVVGSVIAAICCFTPALLVVLPALGLAAWLVWADFVLFPALAIFFGMAAIGFYRLRQQKLARSRQMTGPSGGSGVGR